MSSSSSNLKLPDVIRHTAHVLLWHFHCFSVFVWTGGNVSNTLSVDAYSFEKEEGGGGGGGHLRFQKSPDTWTRYCEWKILHLLKAQKWGSWILNTSSIWFTYEMKSTNKDQSSYLWKLSIITDVGLAHNAMYPWNIFNVLSTETSKRRVFA